MKYRALLGGHYWAAVGLLLAALGGAFWTTTADLELELLLVLLVAALVALVLLLLLPPGPYGEQMSLGSVDCSTLVPIEELMKLMYWWSLRAAIRELR